MIKIALGVFNVLAFFVIFNVGVAAGVAAVSWVMTP